LAIGHLGFFVPIFLVIGHLGTFSGLFYWPAGTHAHFRANFAGHRALWLIFGGNNDTSERVGSPPEARREPAGSAPVARRRNAGAGPARYRRVFGVPAQPEAENASEKRRRASGGLLTRFDVSLFSPS